MIAPRIRHIAGRLIMMVGGEAAQSALSFVLNLALLNALPAKEYGVFALVMITGGIGLTYIRALTAMPASVLIGQHARTGRAWAYDVTFGSAALVLSAAMAAVVAGILGLWVESGAVAGGLFVGLWGLRSHLRTVFFAHGRQRQASLGDLAYILGGCATALPIVLSDAHLLRDVLLVLAGANALGIGVMIAAARKPIRISFGRSMRQRYRRFGRQIAWSVVSVTTVNVHGQGIAFMVAGLAGPAAYAPIAAALVMFVPLRITGTALANMMQPDLSARLAAGQVRSVWRLGLLWMGLSALACLGFGAMMMLVFRFVSVPMPETTSPGLVLVLAWIFFSLSLISVMPRITLEIMGAFSAITAITAASAAMGLGLGYLVLRAGYPSLALAGGVASELAVLFASLALVWRRKRGLVEGLAQRSLFQGRVEGPVPVS